MSIKYIDLALYLWREIDDKSFIGVERVPWGWNSSILFPKYGCVENWDMKSQWDWSKSQATTKKDKAASWIAQHALHYPNSLQLYTIAPLCNWKIILFWPLHKHHITTCWLPNCTNITWNTELSFRHTIVLACVIVTDNVPHHRTNHCHAGLALPTFSTREYDQLDLLPSLRCVLGTKDYGAYNSWMILRFKDQSVLSHHHFGPYLES